MKKILLALIILLFSGVAFAQDKAPKKYDIKEAQEIAEINRIPGLVTTSHGRRVYFDPKIMQYVSEEQIVKKYGQKTVKMLDQWYISNILNKQNDNVSSPFLAKSFGNRNADISKFDNKGRSFKWKLTPLNTVIGSSMIGASAATYMLTSSIIDNKMANESDVEKISSLAKTKRTVGFVCAGTSVIGIVVVLTGLHKEYAQGIEIGHNLTVSDYGAGISLTKKF